MIAIYILRICLRKTISLAVFYLPGSSISWHLRCVAHFHLPVCYSANTLQHIDTENLSYTEKILPIRINQRKQSPQLLILNYSLIN
jgi:hypothetical protein